jgi:hypothetical protein
MTHPVALTLSSLTAALIVATASCATSTTRPATTQTVTGPTVQWHGDSTDPESATRWTQGPIFLCSPDGTYPFINITDEGGGVVKMFLRYRGDWWDGDQATLRKDRQRAEIKGLGPHQKTGETFEYGTTFRTDPAFKAYGRFCHIMQVKATDGDKGAPLVTLSLTANDQGALQYDSGNDGFKKAAEFSWKPGAWETIRFKLKTSTTPDGELLLSVNGAPFHGVTHLSIYRPQATDYRPKWGLYRGTVDGMTDDWVEHKDAIVKKLPDTPDTAG